MKRLIIIGSLMAIAIAATVWLVAPRRRQPDPRLPATVQEFKTMPGGSDTVDAGEYVISQLKQGKLPGFSRDDHGSMLAPNMKPPQEETEAFPMLRIVCLHKEGNDSEFYYWLERASGGASWQLQKAWRASPAGQVLEQYSVK